MVCGVYLFPYPGSSVQVSRECVEPERGDPHSGEAQAVTIGL